jgi:hypothetical protein
MVPAIRRACDPPGVARFEYRIVSVSAGRPKLLEELQALGSEGFDIAAVVPIPGTQEDRTPLPGRPADTLIIFKKET